jgi:hypothetical protein
VQVQLVQQTDTFSASTVGAANCCTARTVLQQHLIVAPYSGAANIQETSRFYKVTPRKTPNSSTQEEDRMLLY